MKTKFQGKGTKKRGKKERKGKKEKKSVDEEMKRRRRIKENRVWGI